MACARAGSEVANVTRLVGTSKLRPMRWDLILQWQVRSGMAPSRELMAAATKAREAWA